MQWDPLQWLKLHNSYAHCKNGHGPVVLLASMGEEKGLLGSDYFIKYPTMPRSPIVSNVNIRHCLNVLLPNFRAVVVLWGDHSSLGRVPAAATLQTGPGPSARSCPRANSTLREAIITPL